MRTASVVADHAAQCGAVLGGGVGPEPETKRGAGHLKVGHDYARLDPRGACLGVDVEDLVHVAGKIDNKTGPDGITGHRGACPAGSHGDSRLARYGEDAFDLGYIAGEDHRGRLHAIVGGVGRVLNAAPQGVIDLDHVAKCAEGVGWKRSSLGDGINCWRAAHGGDSPTVDGPGRELSQA